METLLDYLKLRYFLVAGGLVAAVVLADRFQEYPRGWYERRLNAAARGTSTLGAPITQDLEARESARLKALHRTVSAEISQAKARGFKVDGMQLLADKIMLLDTPQYRTIGFERLNALRLRIPTPMESFRPAADDEDSADAAPAPAPKGAKRRARAR